MNVVRQSDGLDETDFKCGLCGCPLVNLALTDQAPEGCPRLDNHNK